ncbi:MAG: glycoside hydrolase family 97 catalytic domain-containing protein [Sphingomonadales bacterium]|nr:glycoside hydrolase family 97 catalytic domain-containing protein [Sphingomonadales bacterium]
MIRTALRAGCMALLMSAANPGNAGEWRVESPGGTITAKVRTTADGGLQYSVVRGQHTVVEWSPLGLVLSWMDQSRADPAQRADFNSTVLAGNPRRRTVTDRYTMVTGKRRENRYIANELTLDLTDHETGKTLAIEFQAADDGIAFRYILTGQSQIYYRVESEATSFVFGPGGVHWGQPYDKASLWQPAYEAPYNTGLPMGTSISPGDGAGWGIPALFRDEAGTWILLHETGLNSQYHGSHLAPDARNGAYHIAAPLAEDGLGTGSNVPATTLPAALPWRFMIISDRLADVVESNRVFDLAPPTRLADNSWIAPGVATWSWAADHDSSHDFDKLVASIRLAAEMGLDYSLVDANWNKIAPDVVERLVAEGNRQHVGLMFWYNSGGAHNSVTEEPRNLMDNRQRRRAEFARLSRLGVRGVKIDFFQSDKQERIGQYLETLEDAAEFHLMVNFHGCTIPRGWQRTWPNLMTMEAVRGGEHYSFTSEPDFAQLSTRQNTVLPFTRNVIGSMDFTPIQFGPQVRQHLTSNAHEAALGVIFESGIQHLADSAAAYRAASPAFRRYLADLPAAWDETRLLAGYPGRDVVMARRKGQRWYVAGISASDVPGALPVDLRFLRQRRYSATVLFDGNDTSGFSARSERLRPAIRSVPIARHGGFVMILDPLR